MKYQHNYSQQFPATTNLEHRKHKATKIIRLVQDFMKREDFSGLRCLDLGCSIGAVSYEISRLNGNVIGVDIDWNAMRMSAAYPNKALFVLSDGGKLPFSDNSFDLIVCSQVYEHVPDSQALFSEIKRLLKDTGVCFFSGPNRWALMEEHYHLLFLSWLPKSMADLYVRAFGRGTEYFEKPATAVALRKALSPLKVNDATHLLLQDPDRYEMGKNARRLKTLFRILPRWSFGVLGKIVPNFNWLLTK